MVVVVVVGAVVVEVPTWDIVGCIVVVIVGAVVVVGVRGFVVVVSSGGSTSIACIEASVGPSPRFLGTGLIVYHLFLLSQATKAHNQSSSI